MKNIHVLATSQPSTLIKDIWKNTFSLVEDFDTNHTDFKAQHIYITSDEEIKEGDWFYNPATKEALYASKEMLSWNCDTTQEHKGWKKIILTTDQDLIKNGLQPINNEFLEWFVKNSSCEYVEVSEDYFKPSNMVYGHDTEPYKIIILKEEPKLSNICIKCGVDLYATEGKFICQKHPKECKGIYLSEETLLTHTAEQKQHIIDMMKSDEELGLYEKPKQETLEEVAERYWTKQPYNEDAFIEGAKWQQERICDSEVIQRIRASMSDAEARRIIRTI